MRTVSSLVQSRVRLKQGVRAAWSSFWSESGESRCAAGDRGVWHSLSRHWSAFAHSLAGGTRVLDLGCGAGAVARLLVERPDLRITGVDFAKVPLIFDQQIELLAETAMESLPFTDGSFGAAVSQFGFEYAQPVLAAREMARVLAPGAPVSLLVHHADSPIVACNRARLEVLSGLLSPAMRAAFCSGNSLAFQARMSELALRHPQDGLMVELHRSMPSRLIRSEPERQAIWKAVEDALQPELCLAEALDKSCVAPSDLYEWIEPLRAVFQLAPVCWLPDPDGAAIAWSIRGMRRQPGPVS